MAQGNLPTNLNPNDMTIQKIEQENQRTINFINQIGRVNDSGEYVPIEGTDITKLENKIEDVQDEISDLLNFSGEKMRFIQSTAPSSPKENMGWFILT